MHSRHPNQWLRRELAIYRNASYRIPDVGWTAGVPKTLSQPASGNRHPATGIRQPAAVRTGSGRHLSERERRTDCGSSPPASFRPGCQLPAAGCRVRPLLLLSAMRSDLRFAWRTLWKSPTTTLGAMLALALGIGATTTMFG